MVRIKMQQRVDCRGAESMYVLNSLNVPPKDGGIDPNLERRREALVGSRALNPFRDRNHVLVSF